VEAVKLQSKQGLEVWEKLLLVAGGGQRQGQYVARVEDFINNGIVISTPEHISGSDCLRGDDRVVVQIVREDAAYEFTSQLQFRNSRPRSLCILTPPRSIRRVQRRRFCRIRVSHPVSYIVLLTGLSWSEQLDSGGWRTTRSVDISASGIQIPTHEYIEKFALVLLRPELFALAGLPRTVLGVCRRQFKTEGGSFAGLEFVTGHEAAGVLAAAGISSYPAEIEKFTPRQQDRLSHFLFDLQIEQRNKGVL
jgi:c-di-GMP-binding flagellar brake protein YcgR